MVVHRRVYASVFVFCIAGFHVAALLFRSPLPNQDSNKERILDAVKTLVNSCNATAELTIHNDNPKPDHQNGTPFTTSTDSPGTEIEVSKLVTAFRANADAANEPACTE